MAITIEDVRKAVGTITLYCDEFEQSFTQKMEPLKGDEITKLSDDRLLISYIKSSMPSIEKWINDLNFK